MKKHIYFLLLAFSSTVVFSQKKDAISSGIYLSVHDYDNNQLSYEIDCSSEKHKIRPNTHKKGGAFRVVHNKQKIDLRKEDVYGYRDCKGKDFRFENNVSYEIVYADQLILYSNYVDDGEDEHGNRRQKKMYHFSKNSSSKIIPLNLENLKNAYPDNHKFHDFLDTNLNTGSIVAYDDFHDTYKVNRYLLLSREGYSPDEDIEKLISEMQSAINEKDLHALNDSFSSKAKIYEQGSVDDSWEQYRDGHLGKEIEAMKDLKFTIDVKESINQQQMALIRGTYNIQGNIHGDNINSNGLITIAMQVEDGVWKIIHLQFSRGCK